MTKFELLKILGMKDNSVKKLIQYAQSGKGYTLENRRKANGKIRTIHKASLVLAMAQESILKNILQKFRYHYSAMGGIKGSSNIKNALIHRGAQTLMVFDIENFFPSIKARAIHERLSKLGIQSDAAWIITKICTVRGMVPQGTCTSTALANLIMLDIDKKISLICKRNGFQYTRFVDDFVISGDEKVKNFRKSIMLEIRMQNFTINHAKSKIMDWRKSQKVTGIIINRGSLAISRKWRDGLKAKLFNCAKYGPDSQMPRRSDDIRYFRAGLLGSIAYLAQINRNQATKMFDAFSRIDWSFK